VLVKARVAAIGPEGTQLNMDIARKLDPQTEVKTEIIHIQESTLAEQITEILICSEHKLVLN
jgi:hypothetical protein